MLWLKLKLLVIVLLAFLTISSEAVKVIYYKNVTETDKPVVHTVRPSFQVKCQFFCCLKAGRGSLKIQNILFKFHFFLTQGNILVVPPSCKPGFSYEGTFQKRCRKIAGYQVIMVVISYQFKLLSELFESFKFSLEIKLFFF